MKKYTTALLWLLKRLSLNLIAVGLLACLLYQSNRVTEANLAKLRVGMPIKEVVSILGPPLTEKGYRVGVMRLTCFGSPFDFESDEEGINSPGGGLRIGYGIVPKSSWSNSYIIREVPKDRPSAVKNPDLKVWVRDEQCLWIWSDANGFVTHLVTLPVEVSEAWRRKYDMVKLCYELDGWNGVLFAIKHDLAR